jgi:hypothetical protein
MTRATIMNSTMAATTLAMTTKIGWSLINNQLTVCLT